MTESRLTWVASRGGPGGSGRAGPGRPGSAARPGPARCRPPPGPTTTSSAAAISSSRIDRAVSGVRSWCEASEANSRSAARAGGLRRRCGRARRRPGRPRRCRSGSGPAAGARPEPLGGLGQAGQRPGQAARQPLHDGQRDRHDEERHDEHPTEQLQAPVHRRLGEPGGQERRTLGDQPHARAPTAAAGRPASRRSPRRPSCARAGGACGLSPRRSNRKPTPRTVLM